MQFKRHIKLVILLLILGLLTFLYSFSSGRNAIKKIGQPIVEFMPGGNEFLTQNMVNKLLIQNSDTLKNQAKRSLDLHSLEQKILANPYVEEAKVYTTIDGVLNTLVKQREAIARIVGKNKSYYIDKQGVKIPLSNNFSARVVLVFGVNSDEELPEITELVNKILADEFLKKEIISIKKIKQNEFEFKVRSGDYTIDFGKLSNADIKFKKLKAFYNKAYTDKTISNYKKINVKYHNQVVCTK